MRRESWEGIELGFEAMQPALGRAGRLRIKSPPPPITRGHHPHPLSEILPRCARITRGYYPISGLSAILVRHHEHHLKKGPRMCNSSAIEAGESKPCVREFPERHAEHFSADGLQWTNRSIPISTTSQEEGSK